MEIKHPFDEAIELSENYYLCCELDKTQYFNHFIQSIALIETSLSHILNAEGEKLQKAIEKASSVSELLEINDSVNRTLCNTTFLGQTLYLKLESIKHLETIEKRKST